MQRFDEIFAASYSRVMGSGAYNPRFIARFYDLFLGSSATVSLLFARTDMSRQKTMLHDSLVTLVDFSARKLISPQMEHLARVHGPTAHAIPPHLFQNWLDCLVETVREMDPEATPEVELAWRLILAPGIAYLLYAGSQADVKTAQK
jgi:truncated hemoglobin YjbI